MSRFRRAAEFYKRVWALWRGRLPERNRLLFDEAGSDGDYRLRTGLTDGEELIRRRHIRKGADILDVGVGAGRTTPALAEVAGRYVGIDYSETMVAACRERFPDGDFSVMDASDLHAFDEGTFDVVFFSYNGIDYLYPDEKRRAFLSEAARILRRDGILIFSTHNARALVDAGGGRPLKTLRGTLRRLALYLPQRAVWTGDGYVVDPRYDGLVVHHSTLRSVARETGSAGLRVAETIPADHPSPFRWWATRSFYLVCRHLDAARSVTGDPRAKESA